MSALASIMDDCSELVETTMQWLSQSPTAREIDREMGKVEPALGGAPRLSYLRYNVTFESQWFRDHLRFWIGPRRTSPRWPPWTSRRTWPSSMRSGRPRAQGWCDEKHFPAAFDLA